jgi:ATP-binding cassette subfamily G (WHITE) protein 2 (PDR)
MSLVGNFTFQSYDREARNAGIGTGQVVDRGEDVVELSPRRSRTISKRESDVPDDSTLAEKKSGQDAEETEGRVNALARQLTKHSTYSNVLDESPFNAPKDSQLNPHSPNFNARAWAKSILNLQLREPEKSTMRSAGIAFRDLNVHGFGSDTDYQKTVGNIFWEGVEVAKKVFGVGQRKIQILRGFDGLLESGEMLVVLGPPGRSVVKKHSRGSVCQLS